MMTSFPHLVHFLNVWQVLFLRIYVPHFIGDDQIIKYFSIPPKFVFLNLKLILLNQFQDHFILFQFLFITKKLPYKLRIVDKTHYIRDFVQIILSLEYF